MTAFNPLNNPVGDEDMNAILQRRALRLASGLPRISQESWDLSKGPKGCSTPVCHPASYLLRN